MLVLNKINLRKQILAHSNTLAQDNHATRMYFYGYIEALADYSDLNKINVQSLQEIVLTKFKEDNK